MSEEKYNPLKSPYHPLKHLAAMRYVDKDEVLAEMIHSDAPDNLFKVRGAWWAGVNGDLLTAVDERFISDVQLRRRIYQFVRKVEKMKFGDDTPASRRTAEEIAWANQFIDEVLEKTGYANVLLDLSLLDSKAK